MVYGNCVLLYYCFSFKCVSPSAEEVFVRFLVQKIFTYVVSFTILYYNYIILYFVTQFRLVVGF
jgi:hypothetical protein